jgi:hypothetical protein
MENKIGSERRTLQRFLLKAPAVIQKVSHNADRVLELSTHDISSGGAFFSVEAPLPVGEEVRITLYISISPVEQITAFPSKAKITTEGRVVRSNKRGMAIAFRRRYTMSPAEL